MIIMKFGGTSVGSAQAMSRTLSIIKDRLDQKPVVVVSAMSGVTDQLYKLSDKVAQGRLKDAENILSKLRDLHIETVEQLLDGHVDRMMTATSRVNELCDELDKLVRALCVLGELSPRSKAMIISFGERLSSTIMAHAMNANGMKTTLVDARKIIITDDNNLKGDPIKAEIKIRAPHVIAEALKDKDAAITQGFIAATADGMPTVLGRGGSDYSASLLGMAVSADRIEIWTDVDGVLTADPRKVKGAARLDRISFEEAAEMAQSGAKVLHPMTIEPAISNNIPIYVLNSMNPENPGTAIMPYSSIEPGVKSVSYKQDIQVMNIFSTRMIDACGFLEKVFGIFRRHNISVDMISTSEASVSVTVDSTQNTDGVIRELSGFAQVVVDDDKSQVSVVGKNFTDMPGIQAKIFTALSPYRVHMVSQGASNINISFVVDRAQVVPVVRAVHDAIFKED